MAWITLNSFPTYMHRNNSLYSICTKWANLYIDTWVRFTTNLMLWKPLYRGIWVHTTAAWLIIFKAIPMTITRFGEEMAMAILWKLLWICQHATAAQLIILTTARLSEETAMATATWHGSLQAGAIVLLGGLSSYLGLRHSAIAWKRLTRY